MIYGKGNSSFPNAIYDLAMAQSVKTRKVNYSSEKVFRADGSVLTDEQLKSLSTRFSQLEDFIWAKQQQLENDVALESVIQDFVVEKDLDKE
jgi:hypothetical protein